MAVCCGIQHLAQRHGAVTVQGGVFPHTFHILVAVQEGAGKVCASPVQVLRLFLWCHRGAREDKIHLQRAVIGYLLALLGIRRLAQAPGTARAVYHACGKQHQHQHRRNQANRCPRRKRACALPNRTGVAPGPLIEITVKRKPIVRRHGHLSQKHQHYGHKRRPRLRPDAQGPPHGPVIFKAVRPKCKCNRRGHPQPAVQRQKARPAAAV